MEQYIGAKLIKAKPMTRGDYNKLRGWELPKGELCSDGGGYLVEYQDGGKPNLEGFEGYVSWSPKDVFDKAYRKTDGLSFGLAVEALKKGLCVARKNWNAAGQFVYYVPAGKYPARTEAAINFFGEHAGVPYREYMALKTAQGDVATWAPSVSDALADDWMVVEAQVEAQTGRPL